MSQAAARAERAYYEGPARVQPTRRVVRITGQPTRIGLATDAAVAGGPLRHQPARHRVAARARSGPDKLALWAVALGLFMAGLAVVTSSGGDEGPQPQAAAPTQQIPLSPK